MSHMSQNCLKLSRICLNQIQNDRLKQISSHFLINFEQTNHFYDENDKFRIDQAKKTPVNRLQCFFHPRWINCRSRAQMQLRPAPGKGMPICPYGMTSLLRHNYYVITLGGCQHGKCVEKCLFGKCKKSCVCDPGWEGVSCSLDVNDCRRKVNGKR